MSHRLRYCNPHLHLRRPVHIDQFAVKIMYTGIIWNSIFYKNVLNLTLTSSEPSLVLNFTSITASTLNRMQVVPSSSFNRKRDATILLGWVAGKKHFTFFTLVTAK